jgi:hypothetical protein
MPSEAAVQRDNWRRPQKHHDHVCMSGHSYTHGDDGLWPSTKGSRARGPAASPFDSGVLQPRLCRIRPQPGQGLRSM